ncbi:Ig-like domain-containing protein [Duganella callida]|uniref:Ig-like domain-containing protein n=1 Tax=Duganella callida TaxID=2561932 RepID=UPI00353154B6
MSLAGHALTLPEEEDKGVSHSDGVTRAPGAVDLNVAGLHGFHAGDTIQIIDTNHGGAVVGSYVIESGDLYYGDDYFSQSYYNPAQLTSKNLSLSALSDGEHTLVAQVLDQAGNVSSVTSGALDLLIDNVAPQLTGSTPADSSGTVSPSISQLVFSFSEDIYIEDGAVITIVDADDASSYQEVTLHGSNINGNTLTVTLTAPLTSGTHYKVLGVAISDLAGNAGVTGDAILLQFTTTGSYPAPAAPSVALTGDTAPASSAADAPTHSDGITRYNTVHVTDDGKSTWYYRIGDSDSWHEGSGASFTLADGHYAAGEIQVKQSSHGVDSPVAVLGETIIDTHAFTDDTLSGNHFIETNTSVTGSLVSAQTLSDQIIEITLDHGVTWKAATLTPTDATHADWTLGGLDLTNAIEYGVRIADKAGNVTGTAYYLTAREASYNHPEYNDIVLHAAGGIDYITVGARAYVDGGGGYGDIVVTGDDAVVSVGNDSHVTTGNGNNLVSTGFGANIVTGSGNDRIYVSTVDGAHISAGGGNDWLQSNSGVNGLRLESLDISGVETFNFGYSGGNDLTINTAASVRATSGTGTLTFTSTFAGSHMHLNAAQWIADGIQGDYQHYHASNSSEVLLIGQNITVDNNIGSA